MFVRVVSSFRRCELVVAADACIACARFPLVAGATFPLRQSGTIRHMSVRELTFEIIFLHVICIRMIDANEKNA
jgi:hypothetical protein